MGARVEHGIACVLLCEQRSGGKKKRRQKQNCRHFSHSVPQLNSFMSKEHLHAQLDNSLALRNHRGDLSELGGRYVAVRQREIDRVEEVERLSAKLNADPPVGLDDLQQPEIGVEVPRSAQKVASRVAECSDRIERELGGVEPLLNHLRVGAVVAQLRAAAAQILPAVRAAREGVIPSAAN